jgi:transcriptional antiterminator NusG
MADQNTQAEFPPEGEGPEERAPGAAPEAPEHAPDAAPEAPGHAPDSPASPPDGRWYILHTYSGFEQRVEQTIREMMRTGQDAGLIREIVVPTEKVIELGKGGQKRTTTRKFYPGYVMIRMVMTDFSWHLVQNIPKVTGFVGGKNRPAPMGPGEAERILALMETRQEQPRPKFNFERGDEVRVVDGPFGGFNGMVEDVNYDKGKLRVAVSIFGRQTPVELDFIQVSKG